MSIRHLTPRRRLRFFSARRELPRSELARLTQIDYAREMAFIAVRARSGGAGETLGVVRVVIDPDNIEAEFAIVVRSDLQKRGLGTLLLGKMLAFLRMRGTQTVVGDVLRDNPGMRALARSQGFAADAATSNSDALRFTLATA